MSQNKELHRFRGNWSPAINSNLPASAIKPVLREAAINEPRTPTKQPHRKIRKPNTEPRVKPEETYPSKSYSTPSSLRIGSFKRPSLADRLAGQRYSIRVHLPDSTQPIPVEIHAISFRQLLKNMKEKLNIQNDIELYLMDPEFDKISFMNLILLNTISDVPLDADIKIAILSTDIQSSQPSLTSAFPRSDPVSTPLSSIDIKDPSNKDSPNRRSSKRVKHSHLRHQSLQPTQPTIPDKSRDRSHKTSHHHKQRFIHALAFIAKKWILLTELNGRLSDQKFYRFRHYREVFQCVKTYKQQGYSTRQISYFDDFWFVVIDNERRKWPQKYSFATKLPYDVIQASWGQNSRITYLNFCKKGWAVVLEKNSEMSNADQEIIFSEQLPENDIQRLWDNGKRVHSLIYGNTCLSDKGTCWVLVAEKQGKENLKQTIHKTKDPSGLSSFAIKDVIDQAKRKDKMRVHCISYCPNDNLLCIIFESFPKRTTRSVEQQKMTASSSFPEKEFENLSSSRSQGMLRNHD